MSDQIGFVKLPFARLVLCARHIGSQDSNACPPGTRACWINRNLRPFLTGDAVENECAECWLHFFVAGD